MNFAFTLAKLLILVYAPTLVLRRLFQAKYVFMEKEK